MTKADTYTEAHWFTGKIKVRCSVCTRVVYPSQDVAERRAEQIRERQPKMKAFEGNCGHWHVSTSKLRNLRRENASLSD